MIRIITSKISLSELKEMAVIWHGELVKAVVDIKKRIMAVNGDMHSDEEKVLLQDGSKQENLWGINIHPNAESEKRIEFDSMINLRPSQKNMSRGVEDEHIRNKILEIVTQLII
jgi:hypothetical protein